MSYLLGVDIGTSGARSALVSDHGVLIYTAYTNHGYNINRLGWVEQDADVYWKSFCKVAGKAVERAKGDQEEICGISVSGLAPTVLPVDRHGKPLEKTILWLDRRAYKEEEWLKRVIGEDKVFNLTGNIITAYYGLVKILWLKKHKNLIYNNSYKFLNVKDYIVFKLTGKFVSDYSHAAVTAIGFDIINKDWDPTMFSLLTLDINKMPELYSGDEIIGKVIKSASLETGLQEGIRVTAGVADNLGNYLSAGLIEEGENVLSLGTSAVWGILGRSNIFARNMLISPAVNAQKMYLTSTIINFAGGLYQWFKEDVINNISYEQMNEMAKSIKAGSEGVVILPYFAGERTPLWDPNAKGVIFGLSIEHDKSHLIRAAIESIAFALLDNLENIKKYNLFINKKMIITGGGAKSWIIRKVIADVLNMEVVYIGGNISAEVGDAYIAGKGVGIFKDYQIIKENITVRDVIIPDQKDNKLYQSIYEQLYKKLYLRVKDLYNFNN